MIIVIVVTGTIFYKKLCNFLKEIRKMSDKKFKCHSYLFSYKYFVKTRIDIKMITINTILEQRTMNSCQRYIKDGNWWGTTSITTG